MLKQCREAFPGKKVWLIAGVCDQADIEIHKGTSFNIKDQLLAPKLNESQWSLKTNTLMKFIPMLRGSSLKVEIH